MPQDITTLTFNGASCKIHAYGATVTSFVSSDGRENLFLSSQAKLDGSKPIRGGIPICFPIFGPPATGNMPQHGFARCNKWKLESTATDETSAVAIFHLNLKDAVHGCGDDNPWSIQQTALDGTDCQLVYEVHLQAKQLTTTLIIKNTGTSSFNFQALLHTYIAVDNKAATDPSKTKVHGLGGYAITDKVSGNAGHVQSYDEDVTLAGEVDRIFVHPDQHPVLHAKVSAGSDGKIVEVEAAGQVNEQVTSVSAVVWNPGSAKAKSMSDFGDDEYHSMVCVEPGLIGHQPLLEAGQEARLTQCLSVVKDGVIATLH